MSYNRHLIKDFEKCRRRNPSWPVVISEGDSWFSHSKIVTRVDEVGNSQRNWSLLRLEKNGDEILTIMSGGQRSKLRKYLKRWRLDGLLFSAGGNDIIGPDLLPLLRPFATGMSAQDVVRFSRFERRVRQIQDCYRELLDMLDDAGQVAKVFVNSYDYAVPSNKKAKFLGIAVAGPWMLPYFNERQIPKALHKDVVKLLIDGFTAAVDVVAAEPRGVKRLIRVETRGLLNSNNWDDEIHPNTTGAKKVARAFLGALKVNGISV